MPKIILFREATKDHRDNNFIKEASEAKLDFIKVDIHNSIVLPDKIIFNSREIPLNDGDFIWSTSNDEMIHNTICSALASNKKIFAWPSKDTINFVDKFRTASFFQENNIPSPKTVLINTTIFNPEIINYVGGFPCVIKKTQGSHGKDVGIVNSMKIFISSSKTVSMNAMR